MRILVATNHLVNTGGTENFTYALISELCSRGYEVEYFCNPVLRGRMAKKIESELGVSFKSRASYDLVLANHSYIVNKLRGVGVIIQTCHGVFPPLEQPATGADAYVAISREIQLHIESLGLKSDVILNGIDCQQFAPIKKIHKELRCVLSLCQGEQATAYVKQICDTLGVDMMQASKFNNNVFNIEELINKADLVVGVGRSLYDAMACGRACISLDSRDYSTRKDGCSVVGDGYLASDNIEQSIEYNCTGRGTGRGFKSADELMPDFERYCSDDGDFMREYALQRLNMAKNVDAYLEIYNKINRERTLLEKLAFFARRCKLLLTSLLRFIVTLENQFIDEKKYKVFKLLNITLYKRLK